MNVNVSSEIAPLKQVLLHLPGPELEQLTPAYLERMLFDDIPYLAGAQKEHAAFAETLAKHGAQVVYLVDLMAQTLEQDESLRRAFIRDFIAAAGPAAVYYEKQLFRLLDAVEDPRQLVLKTMSGVTDTEISSRSRHPLVALAHADTRFILDPIPNLYFTRDPFATIGGGVAISRMFAPSRQRETIYGHYIFTHHPDYAGQVPLWYEPNTPFNIEGGDILNLAGGVLAVGISQRTTPEAIELLAAKLFAAPQSGIRSVLAIEIPPMRAYMHLDTVFTQVDYAAFTVHPGILGVLNAYRITPGARGSLRVRPLEGTLQKTLEKTLGVDYINLIHCGGADAIASEREQWNDGSNTLCIAPGVVVVYDRNNVTNRMLRDQGLTTIEVPGSELARGRGGPRCMSMPLARGALT